MLYKTTIKTHSSTQGYFQYMLGKREFCLNVLLSSLPSNRSLASQRLLCEYLDSTHSLELEVESSQQKPSPHNHARGGMREASLLFFFLGSRSLFPDLKNCPWENGIETCILSCKKWITSLGSIQDTGCLGLVHWDDPERWYGEGGGRGVQGWELMYTCGGFMSMYGKTNTVL